MDLVRQSTGEAEPCDIGQHKQRCEKPDTCEEHGATDRKHEDDDRQIEGQGYFVRAKEQGRPRKIADQLDDEQHDREPASASTTGVDHDSKREAKQQVENWPDNRKSDARRHEGWLLEKIEPAIAETAVRKKAGRQAKKFDRRHRDKRPTKKGEPQLTLRSNLVHARPHMPAVMPNPPRRVRDIGRLWGAE